jgi:hypothetical protein
MSQTQGINTLASAYTRYVQAFPDRAKFARTAIFRYLLPYQGFNLDFRVEASQSLNPEQIDFGLKLASKIKLEDLSEIERVLSWQKQVFESLGANANVSGTYKSHLKHFLQWCQSQGWLKAERVEAWSIPQNPEKSKRHGRGRKDKSPITSRQSILPYSITQEQLSKGTQTHLREDEKFWTAPHYGDGARPILKTIDRNSFIENNLRILLQLLGWFALDKLDYHRRMWERAKARQEKDSSYQSDWLLVDLAAPDWLKEMHQKYPPKSANELKLEDLVPVIQFRVAQPASEEIKNHQTNASSERTKDATDQLLVELLTELKLQNATISMELVIKLVQGLQQNHGLTKEIKKLTERSDKAETKEKVKEDAEAAAIATRNMVEDFLKWLKFQHNPTNNLYGYQITNNYAASHCDDLINLAKFLYRDITNPLTSTKYQDIPVIMALRSLRNTLRLLPETENVIQEIKRNPTWQELGTLLKTLLIYCAPRSTVKKDGRSKIGPLRRQESVAKDFQRYLITMFFRLIAPDRQHVLRQLRVHDTLRLYSINWDTGNYEEAPWDAKANCYKAHYNTHTKLYYLNPQDAKDEIGNIPEQPQGKAFEWIVTLSKSQTKIDKESSYRIPKIYNPELQAWLYGREDYSGTWDNWPIVRGGGREARDKWHRRQYHWCGYVDVKGNELSGFRQIFKPSHNFVFTQTTGEALTTRAMSSLYENIIWTYLGCRANPHGVRSASTSHYKRKGMTFAQNQSLADIKSHSVKTQDSGAYNKLQALEKTALASEMIVSEFLKQQGLDPTKFGLASPPTDFSE